MNIIKQNQEKINGILQTFDRMIINGYHLNLCNYRHFLYYLIQNNVNLKDFDKFALQQTDSLCSHIEQYIKDNNVNLKYLSSGKINKDELARNDFEKAQKLADGILEKKISDSFDGLIKKINNLLPHIEKISSSIEIKGRKYSAFNILSKDTLLLFKVISSGEYLINGFSNKNIRGKYFIKDSESKKNINKITRLFAKLKAHGIIKKVTRKNKYYLTAKGRKIISNVLIYTSKELLN